MKAHIRTVCWGKIRFFFKFSCLFVCFLRSTDSFIQTLFSQSLPFDDCFVRFCSIWNDTFRSYSVFMDPFNQLSVLGLTVIARCNLFCDLENANFSYISWTYYPAADWLEFV